MVYGERSSVLALQNYHRKHIYDSERIKLPKSCYSQSLHPLFLNRFPLHLWLLNLRHSQSSWPQCSASGGGHYVSALGLEMTRVTDDIRKSHSPRQSSKLRRRNEVAELAELAVSSSIAAAVISISAELMLSKGSFWAGTLQIKTFLEEIERKKRQYY